MSDESTEEPMTISVYRIREDTSFQYLNPVDTAEFMEFSYDGLPIIAEWRPIEVWLSKPLAKEPDFFYLVP